MANLIVLSADVTGMERYLNRNGLYPTKLMYRVSEVIEHLAYANEDMLLLVIIHGFTRFTTTEINMLFRELRAAVKAGAQVSVMTDIHLVNPDLQGNYLTYIVYEGDLFFGHYTWYDNKKKLYDTTEEDAKIADQLNGRAKPSDIMQTCRRQQFWNQFGEFTKPRKAIEGEMPVLQQSKLVDSDAAYVDRLLSIDLGIPDTHTIDEGATVTTNEDE